MTKKMPSDVVFDKQIEVINEVQQTRTRIEKAMNQGGNFTHNIIGLSLSSLASKCGKKYANELIDELGLDDLYGIEKEPE